MSKPINLAILGSTRGSSSQPIIDAIQAGELNAHIQVMLSNKADAGILQRAAQHDIAHAAIDHKELATVLTQYDIDLIVLVGYMRIIKEDIVAQWRNKIINVHPSLLPKHAGLMNLNVHQAVLDAGEHETGCTVHYVDEGVDTGQIIIQEKCVVSSGDTAVDLQQKVQQLEGIALIKAIEKIQKG